MIGIVALTGAFTLVCAAIYVNLDAVDVAFTEAAVGSGISTILMVMAVAKLPEGKKYLSEFISEYPYCCMYCHCFNGHNRQSPITWRSQRSDSFTCYS